MRSLIRFLVVLLFLFLPANLRGDDSYCSHGDAARRVISFSAFDSQRNPITTLTAADLRAEFRGQIVKIDSLRPARGGRVVVLLDVSQSMTSTPAKWRITLAAAEDLVARLAPSIEVGLVIFDDAVRETVEFDQGRAVVSQRLAGFRSPSWSPRRGTYGNPLSEGIEAGLRLLSSGRPGDVIYVITDGRQFGHDVDKGMSEVEMDLVDSGVRLFATEYPGSNVIVYSGGRLKQTAERTGGGTLPFELAGGRDSYNYDEKAAAELSARAAALYTQMQEFFLLEVELPRSVDKLQDWTLEIVDERGRRRKDLSVVYPRRLAPCSP